LNARHSPDPSLRRPYRRLDAFQATHIISQSAKWKHDKRLDDIGVVSAREQHVVPMQWLEDSLEKRLLQNEMLYITKR